MALGAVVLDGRSPRGALDARRVLGAVVLDGRSPRGALDARGDCEAHGAALGALGAALAVLATLGAVALM